MLCSVAIEPQAAVYDLEAESRGNLYYEYKKLNRTIFKLLDPKGLLKGTDSKEAIQIAHVLAKNLAESLRETVCTQISKAIKYRTEWGNRYTFAPQRKKTNHDKYVRFLEGILHQLSDYDKGQEATLATRDQHLEEREQERGNTDDFKGCLTLEQAEFLAFLASLMALASEAAALWGEVAQGKLPIYTASTCECSSLF